MHTPTPQVGLHAARFTRAARCLALASLSAALPAWVSAQAPHSPPPPLTLAALYRAVDSASPRIGAARAAAVAAEARVSGAKRLPDPRLELATMYRPLPGFTLTGPLAMNQVGLTQMFPIPGTGKLGLAGDAAQWRADAEAARVEESIWEQRARAAMAFYDLYRAEGTLTVMGETLRLLEAVFSTVNAMYTVGEARQADVLRAQLETGRMRGQIAEMEAMRRTMTARVNTVLNRTPGTPTGAPLLPVFPESLPPSDTLVARALRSRGMLVAGADQVRAATAAEQLSRREIWPDLEVGVAYGWQPMDGGTDEMLSVMVGATLPIWARSRQLKMRDETAAMRQMAEDDLAAMRADTHGRVAELVAEIQRTSELLMLYRGTLLPQAEATAASARAAYQVGTVDFMTYLDALMTAYDYRAALLRLETEKGQALAELEMVTAQPLVLVPAANGATPGGTR